MTHRPSSLLAPPVEVPAVRLTSVNVAMPAHLGDDQGRPVQSGFRKHPAANGTLSIDALNISGDGQADLTVHGGPEKAVYAYSIDRFPDWRAATDETLTGLGPAFFGENLTVSGWLETDVRIGDVWAWGDARLQVCQPRWPCYKLALASGRPELGKIMLDHGWTGWYFRVLQTGEAPACGPVHVVERDNANVTVFDAHAAKLPGADRALVERVINVPALASRWRAGLQQSLRAR